MRLSCLFSMLHVIHVCTHQRQIPCLHNILGRIQRSWFWSNCWCVWKEASKCVQTSHVLYTHWDGHSQTFPVLSKLLSTSSILIGPWLSLKNGKFANVKEPTMQKCEHVKKPVGVVYVVMATHVIPTWLRHCTGESRHFCTQSTGCQMDHHSPVKEPRSWRKGWRRKICELILSERSHCRAASVSIPGRGERRIDRVQIDN